MTGNENIGGAAKEKKKLQVFQLREKERAQPESSHEARDEVETTDRMTVGGRAMRQRKREKHRVDLMVVFVSAQALFSHTQHTLYASPFFLPHPFSPDPLFCPSVHFGLSFLLFLSTRGYELPYIICLSVYLLFAFSSSFSQLVYSTYTGMWICSFLHWFF